MSTLLHKLLQMTQNFCRMWMQNMRPEAVPAKVFSNHAESAHDSLSMCWPISGRLVSVGFLSFGQNICRACSCPLDDLQIDSTTWRHAAQFKTSWVFWCHGLSHRCLVTTQNLSSNTAKLKNLANENPRPIMGPSQGCQPVASTAETGMRMPQRGATVWDVSPTRCALTIICEF